MTKLELGGLLNVLRACRFFALFSGEEKRVPEPAKTQRSGSQQSRLSLGRSLRGAQWTRGPPFGDPHKLLPRSGIYCGAVPTRRVALDCCVGPARQKKEGPGSRIGGLTNDRKAYMRAYMRRKRAAKQTLPISG